VFHNVTRTRQGRLAIFTRFGAQSRCQPGDSLRYVGALTTDLPEPAAGLGNACEAGNSPADLPHTRAYRAWRVRSLSAGDVVIVRLPDGQRCLAAVCQPVGWAPVDLAGLRFVPAFARTWLLHADGSVTGPHTPAELVTGWTLHPTPDEGMTLVQVADLAEGFRTAHAWLTDPQTRPDEVPQALAAVAVGQTRTGRIRIRALTTHARVRSRAAHGEPGRGPSPGRRPRLRPGPAVRPGPTLGLTPAQARGNLLDPATAELADGRPWPLESPVPPRISRAGPVSAEGTPCSTTAVCHDASITGPQTRG
jgi:hypothetical protein